MRSLFFILIFLGSFARAAELFEPFQSVRQLGMGGVYVFNEHDASGFLQNPAYTCYGKGMNWTIFDIGVGVGDIPSIISLQNSLSSVSNPTSLSGLSPYYGKNIWLGLGGFTSLMTPCFGGAATASGITSINLHNPPFPILKSYYLTEYGIRVGGAIPISPVLSVGMDVKRMDRRGGPVNLGPDTLANLSSTNGLQALIAGTQNEGIGYGIDAGLVSRFEALPFNPTMSLSWRDVGSTSYLMSAGSTSPDRQKDNLVLGMTVDGSLPLLGMAAGIEYRHITDQNEQLGKKIHAGIEASIAFLDARAGFYQGYNTYGVGIDLWLIQIDAAWYRVEKGVYPGQTPDERGQIGIMMDLEFDPNFHLVDAGGRKRRLKQRR